VVLLAGSAAGYGGFDGTAAFVGVRGLNQSLTALNQNEWTGSGRFTYAAPTWWLGGHGAGQVGPLTIGGAGAASVAANHADSLGSEMGALRGSFDVGYPYSPVEYCWIRPCLDVGAVAWVIFCHSVEDGYIAGSSEYNFSRWFAAWTFGAAPGVELMGRVRTGEESSFGAYVKTSYFIPLTRPDWYGDEPSPSFGPGGFLIQFGLRFGDLPIKPFRL
jgi:hypothetical protein